MMMRYTVQHYHLTPLTARMDNKFKKGTRNFEDLALKALQNAHCLRHWEGARRSGIGTNSRKWCLKSAESVTSPPS